MRKVNIHEAKTHLSRLVEEASKGEEIVIAKAGRPVAKLTAVTAGAQGGIRFGLMKDEIWIAEDFDAPLPEDILAAFEGRE